MQNSIAVLCVCVCVCLSHHKSKQKCTLIRIPECRSPYIAVVCVCVCVSGMGTCIELQSHCSTMHSYIRATKPSICTTQRGILHHQYLYSLVNQHVFSVRERAQAERGRRRRAYLYIQSSLLFTCFHSPVNVYKLRILDRKKRKRACRFWKNTQSGSHETRCYVCV